jgi:hypothetical protein
MNLEQLWDSIKDEQMSPRVGHAVVSLIAHVESLYNTLAEEAGEEE